MRKFNFPFEKNKKFPGSRYWCSLASAMDPVAMEPIPSCHVAAVPYPGRGHVNALLNFCRLLASSNHALLISFVTTEEWLGFIGSAGDPPNLRLQSIPNVVPSELGRGADFAGFFAAVNREMEGPFEELLDRLEPPAGFIIADTMLSWALEVGRRRDIPVASFWPMSASAFSVTLHFDLLVSNGHFPVDVSERGDECVDYIPGISSIRLADLSSNLCEESESVRRPVLRAVSLAPKAKCLLLATFDELESHVVDILKTKLPLPIYTVGPSISMSSNRVMDSYFNWLDSQPLSSVLYVSFGSHMMVSGAQMDEIAVGLKASGARFLWVARDDAPCLQEMSGEMGLVVPWCDQLKVLSHSSVGGFLTHCGWNSTMESVSAGKIMLTFPLAADQYINSKLIVEDWRIGIKLKNQEKIVRREEIAKNVQRLMDLEGDESKEMRRRARELQEACKIVIEKRGSSYTNLLAFS